MEKRVFFIMFLMFLSLGVFAQLSVNSSGKVSISNNGYRVLDISGKNQNIYAVRTGNASSSAIATITGICDKDGIPTSIGVEGTSVSSSSTQYYDNLNRSYGVMGTAGHGGNGWNFGVFGRLQNSYGAGVYGSAITNDWGRNISDPYAGYFNGNVQVLGNVQATGSVSGILLGASVSPTSSVSILADDIKSESVSDKMANLSVVSYYKEQPMVLTENLKESEEVAPNWISEIELQSLSKKHYALSAEELEDVFPELVYTNADKSKSINYVEMIPLLLQSINELRSEVAKLKEENNKYSNKKMATDIKDCIESPIELSQNKPNPWNESTEITLSVPESFKNAIVLFFDLTGKQVFEQKLYTSGEQSLKIYAKDFIPGIYIYSLVVDGNVVASKKMLVLK